MKKISLSLLVLALIAISFPMIYKIVWPFSAFRSPVEIKSGPILEKTFRVQHDSSYDLLLSADVQNDRLKAECLLSGELRDGKSCGDIRSKISLTWEVYEGSQLLAAGTFRDGPTGSYSKQEIGRVMAQLDFETGKDYKVVIQSQRDFPELTAFHPKISMEADSGFYKDRFIFLGLIQTLGFVFLLMSGLLAFAAWYQKSKQLISRSAPLTATE